MTSTPAAARTAISRSRLSRPAQLAVQHGVVNSDRTLFDYGCGRGGDMARLSEGGIEVSGWDPVHRPHAVRCESDVVLCAYVLNVIAEPRARVDALRKAWSLARYALVLAVRPEWEADQLVGVAHGDGVVTTKGTFQKFFAQDEVRALLESTTGRSPVAVAPGIFFVFRDAAEAQQFRAKRVRESHVRATRTRVEAAWNENREVLEELVDFYLRRGRSLIPEDDPSLNERLVAAFGSARAGWRLALPLVDRADLEVAEAQARDDLLVWLALEAFTGRPRWGDLPPDLQADLRAHLGSYKDSCAQADALLFGMADERRLDAALRTVPFGKVLPDAVYVHAEYLSELPSLVRVYVGSGRALVGDIDGVTLVKMSRRERRISYLSYPDFERDPHPRLASSLRVDLRTFHIKWRNFQDSANPPVLHRKETMVPASHPTREKFARLTEQEERAGLLDDPSRIGTRLGWSDALRAADRSLRGHRLVRPHRR